jgi:hypothetical protein
VNFTTATFHRNSGTAYPKSRSPAAHCENSTGGTALKLLQSQRHLRYTRLIAPGLHDTAAQIFAIFEGYDYNTPK